MSTRTTRNHACTHCGGRTRSKTGAHAKCRHDADHALTGGRWVMRRGIQVWLPDPEPEPLPDPPNPRRVTPTCEHCGMFTGPNGCSYDHTRPIVFPGRPVCECGCLLARADEDCPACLSRDEWLPWAIEAETLHNRETYRRAA